MKSHVLIIFMKVKRNWQRKVITHNFFHFSLLRIWFWKTYKPYFIDSSLVFICLKHSCAAPIRVSISMKHSFGGQWNKVYSFSKPKVKFLSLWYENTKRWNWVENTIPEIIFEPDLEAVDGGVLLYFLCENLSTKVIARDRMGSGCQKLEQPATVDLELLIAQTQIYFKDYLWRTFFYWKRYMNVWKRKQS